MKAVLLFGVCVLLLGACNAYKLSDIEIELLCTINGKYVSQGHTQNGTNTQAIVIWQPIEAPDLSESPVIHLKEFINGVIVRDEILIPDEVDKETVSIEPFNVTGNTGAKPDTGDEEYMRSLTPDKIQGHKGCKTTFRRIKLRTFLITWPNCKRASVQGIREMYSAVDDCDSLSAIYPAHTEEKQGHLGYKFVRQGRKFKLQNPPSNWFCPCDENN